MKRYGVPVLIYAEFITEASSIQAVRKKIDRLLGTDRILTINNHALHNLQYKHTRRREAK